jgi:hypothetical protein
LIDTSLRRKLILAAATTLAAVAMVSGGSGPAQAEPGSPGQPGEATEVWVETFENGLEDGQLVTLPNYVGADGTTYDADPYWVDGSACNGFVMDGQTTEATMEDAGCSWPGRGVMRDWATELGNIQTETSAGTNHVLANDSGHDASEPGVVLRSTPIQGPNGHYLLVGLNHYGYFCGGGAQPQLSLELGYQSADHKVGDVTVCPDSSNQALRTWLPHRLPADVSRFQYVLKDSQTRSFGNDFAVDTLRVLDETPQLDQEFSRPKVRVEENATLTYTITNVTGPLGLGAKADFGFRNPLPEGLDVDPRSLDTTCGDGVVTESPDGTISLAGGDLETDEEACTVTATVTSDQAGTYDNAAAAVAVRGLLEPGSAQITFVRDNDDDDGDDGDDGDDEDFTAPDTGAGAGADGTSAYGWGGVGALSLATAVGGLMWWRRRATS